MSNFARYMWGEREGRQSKCTPPNQRSQRVKG